MSTPRQTQFAVSARMLSDKLARTDRSQWPRVIAEHTYDLVQHTLERVEPSALAYQPLSDVIARVPDMCAWPDESQANIEAWLTTRPDPKDVERAITPYRRRTAQAYGD